MRARTAEETDWSRIVPGYVRSLPERSVVGPGSRRETHLDKVEQQMKRYPPSPVPESIGTSLSLCLKLGQLNFTTAMKARARLYDWFAATSECLVEIV